MVISKILNNTPVSISQQLYQDFASLFIYLFYYFIILLTIETKHHLSNLSLNKYINSQVPAIFYPNLLLLFYSFTC